MNLCNFIRMKRKGGKKGNIKSQVLTFLIETTSLYDLRIESCSDTIRGDCVRR
jgi:hypothetical protein